jgi:uncharacterized protein (TIGR00251 family)
MILTVHARPGARESRLVEWIDDDTARIDIKAPPEKGKANKELVRYLAKEMGIAKSDIEIIRGATARMKQLEVPANALKAWQNRI